jgi:hypothetical protein
MKKRLVLAGLIGVLAAFGLAMAACDNGNTDGGGDGGKVPSGLIGKWSTRQDDLVGDGFVFEFLTNNVYLVDSEGTFDVRFSNNNKKIEYYFAGVWYTLISDYAFGDNGNKLTTTGGDYGNEGPFYRMPK